MYIARQRYLHPDGGVLVRCPHSNIAPTAPMHPTQDTQHSV
jgi:hypothetical protein